MYPVLYAPGIPKNALICMAHALPRLMSLGCCAVAVEVIAQGKVSPLGKDVIYFEKDMSISMKKAHFLIHKIP